MEADELKQLIDLHNVYQKHAPMRCYEPFGAFKYGHTLCKTCLLPLRMGADGQANACKELTPGDLTLLVCSICAQEPAIFGVFKAKARELGMAQAYADLVLGGASGCMDMAWLWGAVRQLGVPSAAVLGRKLNSRPVMALAAARWMPELRPRAYSIIIKSDSIDCMHRYCQLVTSHTDTAMLAAAQSVAGEHECANVAKELEQFEQWHKRKLAWEK